MLSEDCCSNVTGSYLCIMSQPFVEWENRPSLLTAFCMCCFLPIFAKIYFHSRGSCVLVHTTCNSKRVLSYCFCQVLCLLLTLNELHLLNTENDKKKIIKWGPNFFPIILFWKIQNDQSMRFLISLPTIKRLA